MPKIAKQISNMGTKMRREHGLNDMMQVVSLFEKNKIIRSIVILLIQKQILKNNVMHIFWVDGSGMRNHNQYDDLLSVDTTYKTNKYNLKFAPFVGVNSHRDNCLFACGVIQDEKRETFEWLFNTFLKYMGGKSPKSVITDQDANMKKADPKCFPKCNHMNCLFHILTKTPKSALLLFEGIVEKYFLNTKS